MKFCWFSGTNEQTLSTYSQPFTWSSTSQEMSLESLFGFVDTHTQTDRHVENSTSFRYRAWCPDSTHWKAAIARLSHRVQRAHDGLPTRHTSSVGRLHVQPDANWHTRRRVKQTEETGAWPELNLIRRHLRCKILWLTLKSVKPFNRHIKTAEQRSSHYTVIGTLATSNNTKLVHWPLMPAPPCSLVAVHQM